MSPLDRAVRTLIAGAAIVLAATVVAPHPATAESHTEPPGISTVNVRSRPLEAFDLRDPSRVRFGSLEFRSGLVLTSAFKGFGGLSALRLGADGESFIALSDKGDWFTGNILYAGKAMTGLANVKSGPLL